MEGAHTETARPRVLYLATTFPRFSETFLQREVQYLQEQSVNLDIRSLWGGDGQFDKEPVETSSIQDLPQFLSKIPVWILRCPDAFREILGILLQRRLPMVQNWLENFWGFAWALNHARAIQRNPPDLIHATWGTMPAAAALALNRLTGLPFSMEAHAYDVFKHGGDWLLEEKMQSAKFIRTSTRATRDHLLGKDVLPEKIHLVRRGIQLQATGHSAKLNKKPMRILSVGRLVEKKDFSFQLAVFHALKERGFSFEAEIVGHGPLEEELHRESNRRGLDHILNFRGRLNYHNVEEAYHRADLFLFTGQIAKNGDRDGFPNVVAEAMTLGVPVLTTPSTGVLEAIEHGSTGFVLDTKSPQAWADTIQSLQHNRQIPEIRTNARSWINENFDIQKNGQALFTLLMKHAKR